jgi:pimeloyl-ACP methyl ester carboxylesterase
LTHYTDSADGVTIAYSRAGEGVPALVFVHGGLADRTFWSNQMEAFANRFTIIALDLAGHGESGRNRTAWSIQAFGSDVRAVIDAENVKQAVLIGNSMGGPAALEAALLVPERVIGVIGVDTFHALDHRVDPSDARARAEMFRTDFAGAMQQMVGMLFHPDADLTLVRDVQRRMALNADAELWRMFESFANYDQGASIRRLKLPIRCINGDLFPINFEENRRLHADFDAVVFPHTGHYPMLERAEDFNRALAKIVDTLQN